MKILDKWLQMYFKEELPNAEKLAELFTFKSFEIEEVIDTSAGKVIDAKILPDRAHFCLSYKGIAEEVKVLTGLSYGEKLNEQISADDSLGAVKVNVEDSEFCRRYVARRINNISPKETPAEMKSWLEAMDGRSINSIVDATNVSMFDIGQPLHAFDADKVRGDIAVRYAKEGETITLLDGREVALTSADSVIADDEGPLAIAGVKGGKRAEVAMGTKNIILESANFHPTAVRKTATKYNLRNESSKRFENEITPEFALEGINHVSMILKKLHPEAVYGPVSDFYPAPAVKKAIEVSPAFITEKLGIEIPKDKVLEILARFSIETEEKGDDFILTIPFHRLDLVIKEDIVEEVGRIWGYDKIEGRLAPSSSPVPAHPSFYATEHIKDLLVSEGFSEVSLYALVPKGDIEVAYPLASDKKALRTNLSESMAKALEMNARNADFLQLEDIKMFSIGKVFTEKGEHASLCVGISVVKKVKGKTPNEEIRQTREKLIAALGAPIMTVCTVDDTGGILLIKGKPAGTINNIDGIMELDLDMLIPHLETPSYESLRFGMAAPVRYQPFSAYPFMVRDIAVFVPESVSPEEVLGVIAENGTSLLLKYKLFDTFKKEGKISYAYRMIFQSFEKTLTDEEINKIMEAISSKMKEKGWEVR